MIETRGQNEGNKLQTENSQKQHTKELSSCPLLLVQFPPPPSLLCMLLDLVETMVICVTGNRGNVEINNSPQVGMEMVTSRFKIHHSTV